MVDNLFFKRVNPSETTRFNNIIESTEFDNIWKVYERAEWLSYFIPIQVNILNQLVAHSAEVTCAHVLWAPQCSYAEDWGNFITRKPNDFGALRH